MKRLYAHEPLLLHAGLGMLTLALACALSFGHRGGFYDVQQMTQLFPSSLWSGLTLLGDERVLLAICLPFCLRNPRLLWSIVLATLLAALACRALKWGLALPRPLSVLPEGQVFVIGHPSRSPALPSGHTATVFAVLGIAFAWLERRMLACLLAMAVLSGLSRIAVGAHWPLDVLIGAAIGLIAARCAFAVVRRSRWGEQGRPFAMLMGAATIAVGSLCFDTQGYADTQALCATFCVWGIGGLLIGWRKAGGAWRGTSRVIKA